VAKEFAEAMLTMTPRLISRVPFLMAQVLGVCFLSHGGCLCAYTEQIAPRVNVHDAIKVFDVSVCQRSVNAIVDLCVIKSMLDPIDSTLKAEAYTYPGTVDAVIETTILSHHEVHHVLHRLGVLDIHLEDSSLILFVASIFAALLRRSLRRLLIHVGKHDDFRTRFGK
jgi:hypothetical protein